MPETLAPWVALLFAINILVGCALAATIRGTRGFAFLTALLVATIVGGGIAGAVLGERPIEAHVAEEHAASAEGEAAGGQGEAPAEGKDGKAGEGKAAGGKAPEAGKQAPAGPVAISAQGLTFDTSELTLAAGGEAVIAFDNKDTGIPHNVAVYTEPGGEPVFQGEIVSGPATTEYRFPAPEPGTYYFQCDVHPQMSGSVVVA